MRNLVYIIVFLLLGCSGQQEQNGIDIDHFCSLNQSIEFKELYKTIISSRSFDYDKEMEKYYAKYLKVEYYDSLLSDFFILGIVDYPYSQSEIESALEELSDNDLEVLRGMYHTEDNTLLKTNYINHLKSILIEYFSINLPIDYSYLSVMQIKGNPKIGRFIQFKLSENALCYYLEDKSDLYTEYWKNRFKNMESYNKNWYYNWSKN